MSGAYHNRFAEEVFVYEYEGLLRKAFRDAESARRYFEADDRRVKWRFLRVHARLGDLLRARGVGPWDPFLEAKDVRDENALDALASFPRNVRLPLRKGDRAHESLELTLRAPISAKGLLVEARSLLPKDDDAGEDAVFEDPPISAHRFGSHFGLFVGSTVETRPEPATRLRACFARVLDALFPEVEERLSDPAKIAALGLSGARPLRESLPATTNEALLFNPWGPLYDTFAREGADLGRVHVIVLFAPARTDPSQERLDSNFVDWLRTRARAAARATA